MLYLRLFSLDRQMLLLMGFIFAWFIFALIVTEWIAHKSPKLRNLCRILCVIPALVSAVHFIFFSYSGKPIMTLTYYGGVYLLAVFAAGIGQVSHGKRPVFKTVFYISIALILCAYTVAYPAITNCDTRNYSHMSYTESFEAMLENMHEYDSVSPWKGTDFDRLSERILPLVQKAEADKDAAKYYAALCEFTYNLYDGHSWVKPGSEGIQTAAEEIMAGNDYGFSMVRLSTGEVIAVCVEKGSEASKAGIAFGSVITKWDGQPIDDAIDQTKCVYTKEYGRWPVQTNEAMYQPIFLAGRGSERITVEFKNTGKTAQTIQLGKIGSYRARLEKAAGILQAKEVLSDTDNLSSKMLNDTVGYIHVSTEETNLLSDIFAYFTGHHPKAKQILCDRIEGLKAKGMTKLIIDVRNNTGGYTSMVRDWASLFTDRRFFADDMAYCGNGHKRIVKSEWVEPDGRYSELPVVVLTNSRCVSAGDYFVYCLGQCKNVTIAGMTCSTGSSQPTGGNCVLSDCIAEVRFPVNWMLDADGNAFIDTDASRISRLPNDVYFPLTADFARRLFEDGQDYELSEAVRLLNQR